MNASMFVLIAMIVVTALVAVYRWIVARKDDEFLHIEDPTGVLIANQKQTGRALSRVDHIGIGLTVLTAVYALALVGSFFYNGLYHGLK
jgi:hypothetical protein